MPVGQFSVQRLSTLALIALPAMLFTVMPAQAARAEARIDGRFLMKGKPHYQDYWRLAPSRACEPTAACGKVKLFIPGGRGVGAGPYSFATRITLTRRHPGIYRGRSVIVQRFKSPRCFNKRIEDVEIHVLSTRHLGNALRAVKLAADQTTTLSGNCPGNPRKPTKDRFKARGARVIRPPYADLSNAPEGGSVGESVPFDAGYSNAGEFGPIRGYLWNFGDGTTSSEANPQHTWSTPGDYSVTLVVTDNASQQSKPARAQIHIGDPSTGL